MSFGPDVPDTLWRRSTDLKYALELLEVFVFGVVW